MSIPPRRGPKSSTWTTCRTTSEGTNATAPLVQASKHRADLIRVLELVGFSVRSVFLSSSRAQLIFHFPPDPAFTFETCSFHFPFPAWVDLRVSIMCETRPEPGPETICQAMIWVISRYFQVHSFSRWRNMCRFALKWVTRITNNIWLHDGFNLTLSQRQLRPEALCNKRPVGLKHEVNRWSKVKGCCDLCCVAPTPTVRFKSELCSNLLSCMSWQIADFTASLLEVGGSKFFRLLLCTVVLGPRCQLSFRLDALRQRSWFPIEGPQCLMFKSSQLRKRSCLYAARSSVKPTAPPGSVGLDSHTDSGSCRVLAPPFCQFKTSLAPLWRPARVKRKKWKISW